MSRTRGISEEQIRDLADFEASPHFSELQKLVLRYAVEMTNTPVTVSDHLFARLSAQFTPRQLVELTSSIAWENYRARFDHAFGIEAAGFAEEGIGSLTCRSTADATRRGV